MHYHGRIERLELKVKELEAQAQRMWDWTDFANDRLMATKPGDVLRCSECDESATHEHVFTDLGRRSLPKCEMHAASCCRPLAQATPEWELLTRAAQQAWARIEAALAVCEQQAKDRSPWSDDREQYGLDYVDGWNDALDRVETLLRGESGE